MKNRTCYNVQETYKNLFYQLPKFLFEKEFKGLSNDAKILYSLLKDRHELSILNNWHDENGDIFIYFTREKMQEILQLSENSVNKAMRALKDFDLIQEQRQGLGKPNKIYLLTVTNGDFTQNLKFCGSGTSNFEVLEPQNLSPNNTNINNTNINNSQSVSQVKTDDVLNNDRQTDRQKNKKKDMSKAQNNEKLSTNPTPNNDNYKLLMETLQDNIEYSFWKLNRPTLINLVDEILFIMIDTILSETKYIVIQEEKKPAALVKSVLMKLNSEHIDHTLDQFNNATYEIKNKKRYILSCLYNSFSEIHSHNQNLYNSR